MEDLLTGSSMVLIAIIASLVFFVLGMSTTIPDYGRRSNREEEPRDDDRRG